LKRYLVREAPLNDYFYFIYQPLRRECPHIWECAWGQWAC